jgi:hypothetical protein
MSSLIQFRIIDHELCVCECGLWATHLGTFFEETGFSLYKIYKYSLGGQKYYARGGGGGNKYKIKEGDCVQGGVERLP